MQGGLIWLDANLDSHTPSTTPSGTIHGMSVSHLLGYGETALASILDAEPKIKPENLCLIGVRKYDRAELELLNRLNVKIVMMDEVIQKGLSNIMQEAIAHVSAHSVAYGVSLDLNVLDSTEAPGVGKPVPGGMKTQEVCDCLQQFCNDPGFIGMEIVEFNPEKDTEDKTKKLFRNLLKAVFVAQSSKA